MIWKRKNDTPTYHSIYIEVQGNKACCVNEKGIPVQEFWELLDELKWYESTELTIEELYLIENL